MSNLQDIEFLSGPRVLHIDPKTNLTIYSCDVRIIRRRGEVLQSILTDVALQLDRHWPDSEVLELASFGTGGVYDSSVQGRAGGPRDQFGGPRTRRGDRPPTTPATSRSERPPSRSTCPLPNAWSASRGRSFRKAESCRWSASTILSGEPGAPIASNEEVVELVAGA